MTTTKTRAKRKVKAAPSIAEPIADHDAQYLLWLDRVQARYHTVVEGGMQAVFTTDAGKIGPTLFDTFLNALPVSERQHHNCSHCRNFINTYGGLVVITEDGVLKSAMWAEADAGESQLYADATFELGRLARRARVTGVFLSSEKHYGTRQTGKWFHLAVKAPAATIWDNRLQTAGQHMAEKRADFQNMMTALGEWETTTVNAALNLIRSDSVYQSEKVTAQADFLAFLYAAKGKTTFANTVWLATARAPAGFLHPRSSMIGTLLDDLKAGMSLADAARRFADKMQPLKYMRPQAGPTAGEIAAAEKVFRLLAAENSLKRRFARLGDLNLLWKPSAPAPMSDSAELFGHLTPGARGIPADGGVAAGGVMTLSKFIRTIVPDAERIEFLLPRIGGYVGVLTAEDPDAPPLLRWDRPEKRNPVSWYSYADESGRNASSAEDWGMRTGTWHEVTGMCLLPHMWGDEAAPMQSHFKGAILVLKGAKDSREGGLALFPSDLRAEFHSIRSVVEAHSRTVQPTGREEGDANGYVLGAGAVRVTTKLGRAQYNIDRWD